MPVVTAVAGTISRPEELVEVIADKIRDSTLPFEYVAKYDERLVPKYPCVQVTPGPTDKILHGTHTFQIALRAIIYVMHGRLTASHQVRSYEDLLLATDLVKFLESDMRLGGLLIFGFVESEIAQAFPEGTTKNEVIVGTRLQYTALSETRFK